MGTPAIIQFCAPDGAIEAQLYVHNDGGDVPEWIDKVLHEHKRHQHYRAPRRANVFAAAFTAWRYDQTRAEFSMGLFDALQYTPRPTLCADDHAHLWRVTVWQDGADPTVEEVLGYSSIETIAIAASQRRITCHRKLDCGSNCIIDRGHSGDCMCVGDDGGMVADDVVVDEVVPVAAGQKRLAANGTAYRIELIRGDACQVLWAEGWRSARSKALCERDAIVDEEPTPRPPPSSPAASPTKP